MTGEPIDSLGSSATERPVVVVSNRLPVRVSVDGQKITSTPTSGGLVTALAGLEERPVWVGWPGSPVPADRQVELRGRLAADRLVPVFLTEEEEILYYRGFCNTALWPLFHYFTSSVAYSEEEWQACVSVNERFATTTANCAPRGARVWVHDFHLMLVPAMLRLLRPDLEIGFFLHIPFPSSEVYRLLPRREDLLMGLLGADHVGFHTSDYARHFRSTCVRVLGLDTEWDSITWATRSIGVGVHPIGIDTASFASLVGDPRTRRIYGECASRYGRRRVLLGIERLDYTKGVGLKLSAFERFLEEDPSRVETTALLQVLVPSRLDHPEYKSLKSEIEESIGRINGTFGRPGLVPIHYLHRSLSPEELVALYRYASVCLVTPVRDGMNLVAQEFVACQAAPDPVLPQCRGVLVLSEFAGAAQMLGRALLVNPWNRDQVASAIAAALDLDEDERRARIAAMAESVRDLDCNIWASRFLAGLSVSAARNRAAVRCRILDEAAAGEIVDAFEAASERVLFLDYDGTLGELASRPELASPTPEIRRLLEDLAALPGTIVHLVSGRPKDTMGRWFGSLPIHLCAEHGAVWREPGGEWQQDPGMDLSWMDLVRPILEATSREVHGSFVEEKSCALAWHYRLGDVDYGPWRARELRSRLDEELANQPVEVLTGRKVVEIRAAGVSKGRYVARAIRDLADGTFVLCAGDDRTDMDMYPVLPGTAYTIHVGSVTDEARFSAEAPEDVRALLRRILESARSE
ncbi:MAG: bifunctional alpha,alpha-trehalose-phosphate synthase (UDP-forming)/trehalose-phosphatase [Planctomycetota bacterium]